MVASLHDTNINGSDANGILVDLFAAIWEHSGSNANVLIDAITTGDTSLVISTATEQPDLMPDNVHLVRALFRTAPNLYLHGTLYWARAYPLESGWNTADESAYLVHHATE